MGVWDRIRVRLRGTVLAEDAWPADCGSEVVDGGSEVADGGSEVVDCDSEVVDCGLPEVPGDTELRALADGAWAGRWERAATLLAVARDAAPRQRAVALDALAAASGSWWTILDETSRAQSRRARRYTARLTTMVADGEADLLDLVIAGCHHDGRLRQAAVARLREHRHPVAVAVLALRCADWVDPVRADAYGACELVLDERIDGPRLLMLAELAEAMRHRVRARQLCEQLDALVPRLPEQTLAQLLREGSPRVRRRAHQHAVAAGRLPADRLVTAALRDPDVVVRTMCANAAFAAAPDLSVARALLAAGVPLIRSEAVRLLARAGDVEPAWAALADRSPLVRIVAQVAVRRDGGDPAEHYRRLLAGSCPGPGAIAGLGETGTAADAALITRWLIHPAARGRIAAVRALVACGSVPAPRLLALLGDSSTAVVAQAAAALAEVVHELDVVLLHELLRPGSPATARIAAFRLLLRRDLWHGLAASLRLVAEADPVLLPHARSEVAKWPRHLGPSAYRGLTAELTAEILAAVEQARPVLGESWAELLRWSITPR
ncbi:hypothetical protein [Catellatospora citrea]|uniref:HEAT repeat protein n=1 Tax=Catellatospora citrea TaxID=53366 RepID=A0A8J3NXZ2_9ACTN|nr:hypothetical protein [Catellatospora citrea]RKE05604.1 hypothetical protein C8E86_0408 [Catellatospora citrea]GIF96955.1 hypothetical protein Cci01nite_20490 [Catellatospora citrea]